MPRFPSVSGAVAATLLAATTLLPSAFAQCPTAWDAIGPPGTNNAVYAMTRWDPDGAGPLAPRLVVGGTFTTAGGAAANQLAVWDGTSWSRLGTNFFMPGEAASVQALAVLPPSTLIAGGNFQFASGVQAPFIAQWTGTAWAAMGSGFDAEVRALSVLSNGTLVAGGMFTVSGSTATSRVAYWNGAAWMPFNDPPAFGEGAFGGPVNAIIAVGAGEFIIGGDFTSAFGSNARSIARWSTVTRRFTPYANGIFGGVRSLLQTAGGPLFAGGGFTTANGGPADNITRWDGLQWQPVGGGTNGAVLALAQAPDGGVIASGAFTTAGGLPASRIARFQGAWSAVGAGVTHASGASVRALLPLPDVSTAVGGFFSAAGGRPANNIARFGPAAGSPDFNGDGDIGTDQDIEAFFRCLAGNCCATCPATADFNGDGDIGTDADIESFFRVLAGGAC